MMTIKRRAEIRAEAMRRRDLWIKNEGWDKMTCGGSALRFEMSLGLAGYPFEKKPWMNKEDYCRFVSDVEIFTTDYDLIIKELFKLKT